jgi:hypothetical protein
VEWIVGALAAFGLIAVVLRFVARDEAGELALPRIVDESVGMWALRRVTGRPLGDRSRRRGLAGLVAQYPAELHPVADLVARMAARRRAGERVAAVRRWRRRIVLGGALGVFVAGFFIVGAAVGAAIGPRGAGGGGGAGLAGNAPNGAVLGVSATPGPSASAR